MILIEDDRLAEALLGLSQEDREIFMMHWFLRMTDEQIAMYQEYFPQPVPAAVSFEVRSAADMKEFMNLMFGKGWDMDTGAAEDMEAGR